MTSIPTRRIVQGEPSAAVRLRFRNVPDRRQGQAELREMGADQGTSGRADRVLSVVGRESSAESDRCVGPYHYCGAADRARQVHPRKRWFGR